MTGDGPRFYVGPSDEQDKYRLLRQVGHGGEAELWKAELDLVGGQEPVAVKILHADHHSEIATWRQRWADQVDLLRLIHHPGVVGMHTLFEGPRMHPRGQADPDTSCLYLVMNWVDGLPLRDWVTQHPGPEHRMEALRYLDQVAAVLEFLHNGRATRSGRPVIHGDLSPSNVIINRDGQAVLVDFGLFRLVRHVTAVGAGTAGYCAPEVARGGEYSPASDRYAFGGLAYYVLTGMHPPTDPQQLHAGLSVIAGAGDRNVNINELAAIFSEDPALRPSADQWLRLLRLHTSTVSAQSAPLAPAAHPIGLPSAPPQPGPGDRHAATQRPWVVVATSAVLITSVLLVAGVAAMLFPRAIVGQPEGRATMDQAGTSPQNGQPAGTTQAQAATGPTHAPEPSSAPTPGTPVTSSPEGRKADIDELPVVDHSNLGRFTWGTMTVDGRDYLKVFETTDCDDAWTEYQLSKNYLRFHADVGIGDLARTGAKATFIVRVDGTVKVSKTLTLFRTETIDVSLVGAQRMRISLYVEDCPDAGFIDPYVIAV